MKKTTLSLFILIFFGIVLNAQVGIGTTDPDINSVLEISSPDKGLLMPRVALLALDNPAPLDTHVAGMTIYNTATSGTAPNEVTPGFYVNDGTKWIKTYSSDGAVDAKWVNIISGSVELLNLSDGTTVRPVGTEFAILDNGNVGVGTTAASDKLTVDIASQDGNGITITGNGATVKAFNFAEIGPLGQGSINWRKTGLEAAVAASIRSVEDDSYSNKGIAFFTGNNEDYVTDAVERMRLTSTGRLGIGTTTPNSRVHIAYDSDLTGLNVEGITFDVDANNDALIQYGVNLTIKNTGSNRVFLLSADEGTMVLNADDHHPGGMFFRTGMTTRMEIQSTSSNNYDGVLIYDTSGNVTTKFGRLGRVGIGNSAPTERLDVNGAIKISDGGYISITDGDYAPVPTGGAGTMVFSNGSFFGWNGSEWKQLDN